jgi:radical SAM protein with 4Fe4S-binding SPASM domain
LDNASPPAVAPTVEEQLHGLVEFVRSTREHVYLRDADHTLILRPNKIFRLNDTAWEILTGLYANTESPDPKGVAAKVAHEYDTDTSQVLGDLQGLMGTVSRLLRDEAPDAGYVRRVGFGSKELEWPILSEIALTYGCQARCRFCYASAPDREADVDEMSPEDVERVIDMIADEAQCPSLSFSGGEPTLIKELPRYVARAKSKGIRVNVITNGIRCADPELVDRLAEAGLDSAQVSLEGGTAELHDDIVGRPGSFEQTVRGVRELRRAGIHTHTNTTICGLNKRHLPELVEFLARELESEYFSMNIVIRTGASLGDPDMNITYGELKDLVPPVFDLARGMEIKPVWYSPTPLCLFNPMEHGVSSSTCACCESLLSVSPSGDVLPCSSFEEGVGNLLSQGFERVWRGARARYWRSKAAAPPGCAECSYYTLCYGACPLYWDDRGSFEEIDHARPGAGDGRGRPSMGDRIWSLRRRLEGRVFGVGAPSTDRERARRE